MLGYIFLDKAPVFATDATCSPLFSAAINLAAESIFRGECGDRQVIARGPQLRAIDCESYDALCYLSFQAKASDRFFTATWTEILSEMGRHPNTAARRALVESIKRLHAVIFDDLPINFKKNEFLGLSDFEPQKLLPSVNISKEGLTWSLGERAHYLVNMRPTEDKGFIGTFGMQLRGEARALAGESVPYLLHRQFSSRIPLGKTVRFKDKTLIEYAFGASSGDDLKNRKGSVKKALQKISALGTWKITTSKDLFIVTRLESNPIFKLRWIRHAGQAK